MWINNFMYFRTKNSRVCIIFFIVSNQNNRNRARIIFNCFVICLNQIFVHVTITEAYRVVCLCSCFSSSLAHLSRSKIWDLLVCFSKLIHALLGTMFRKTASMSFSWRRLLLICVKEVMLLTVIFLWGRVLERFGLFFPVTWTVPPHKTKF